MSQPQSFEVTQYTLDANEIYERAAAIKQIFSEMPKSSPAFNVSCKLSGNRLTIEYHCYEMHLPVRMRAVQDQAETIFKETLKHLKKEFKSRLGTALAFKELKELANYNVQKVSLNERYHYLAWRVYELP